MLLLSLTHSLSVESTMTPLLVESLSDSQLMFWAARGNLGEYFICYLNITDDHKLLPITHVAHKRASLYHRTPAVYYLGLLP